MTLEEFLALPETQPAREYRNGKVVVRASPKAKHCVLQGALVEKLNNLARPFRLGHAFPELRCTFAGNSFVFDVAFFAWEHIRRDATGEVEDDVLAAPDLAIEILSAGQSRRRDVEKLEFSIEHGSRLGWFFEPRQKRVTVFRPGAPATALAGGDLDLSPVLPDARFSIAEVFGWLKLDAP